LCQGELNADATVRSGLIGMGSPDGHVTLILHLLQKLIAPLCDAWMRLVGIHTAKETMMSDRIKHTTILLAALILGIATSPLGVQILRGLGSSPLGFLA
jgi:hypothetical protein